MICEHFHSIKQLSFRAHYNIGKDFPTFASYKSWGLVLHNENENLQIYDVIMVYIVTLACLHPRISGKDSHTNTHKRHRHTSSTNIFTNFCLYVGLSSRT